MFLKSENSPDAGNRYKNLLNSISMLPKGKPTLSVIRILALVMILTWALLILREFALMKAFGQQESVKIAATDSNLTTPTGQTHNDSTIVKTRSNEDKILKDWIFNISPAVLQILGLICITWWAGTWLHKKQGKWNDNRVRSQILYQWKYDSYKEFGNLSIKAGQLLGKYARANEMVTLLSKSGNDQQKIENYLKEIQDCKKEIINYGMQVVNFISRSKILFSDQTRAMLEEINNSLLAIVKGEDLSMVEREGAKEFGKKFANIINLMSEQLQKELSVK